MRNHAWLVVILLNPATLAQEARPRAPDVSGEILYQIMPIAWRDSDNDPDRFGDFRGLTASLDYLHELGITAVYLNPIFPSAAYHGYQHGDASRVNHRLGTEADFLGFVAAAHSRGMKVYLDYVAYGISEDSVWFKSAHGNPDSEYSQWLAFTNPERTKYKSHTYKTWNGESLGFIHWNLDNPGPVSLVTQWARKWLDPDGKGDTSDGIDGYRLDHIYASAPEGWGATISFWQTWATSLQTTKPDVFIFGEPGDWKNLGTDLLTPTGFDAVIAKPFEFAARDALASGSAAGLYAAMNATLAAIPDGKTLIAELNDHDSDRLASVVDGSVPKCKLAAAILLTQPFPPNIYSGDEIGMLGKKGNFGGDANDIPMREPFKWNAVAGPPMSNYFRLNTGAYEHRYERDNDGRSVEEQMAVPGSLLEEFKALIAIRKKSPALRRGRYAAVTSPDMHIWSFLRTDPEACQTVLVAMNLCGEEVSTTLNLQDVQVSAGTPTPVDMITEAPLATVTSSNRMAYPIILRAHGYRILSIQPYGSPRGDPVP